jgi:uncharacterized integral membrane protein (TIGR00697 family)
MSKNNALLAVLLFTILISSCIAGQNLITFWEIKITSGALIFPFTYILVAISTEINGLKYTRSLIRITAFCSLVMSAIIMLFTILPSDKAYIGDIAIYHKFCSRLAYLMSISSFAYLISEYINSWALEKFRIMMNGRHFILRVFLSSSIGSIVDTWLVFPFFISRQTSLESSLIETCIHMFLKLGYDLLLLPIGWLIIEYIKRQKNNFDDMLPDFIKQYSSRHYLSSILVLGEKQ